MGLSFLITWRQKPSQDLLLRRIDLHGEDLFLLASVQGKDPVSRNFAHRLLKLIIHLILQKIPPVSSPWKPEFPYSPSVSGYGFCNPPRRKYIPPGISFAPARASSGRLHAFLLRQEGFRFLKGRFLRRLQHQDVCQRFQSLLLRHSRPGAPFRPVGAVKILHRHQSPGFQDLRFQFRRKFALFFYTSDNLFLLLFQISQVKEPFMKRPELFVVQGNRWPPCGNAR